MATSKKQNAKDDLPTQRLLRQKEIVDNMKRENETLRMDLTQESRDAKKTSSLAATTDIARLVVSFRRRVSLCFKISITNRITSY
jgi:hypothetical protein